MSEHPNGSSKALGEVHGPSRPGSSYAIGRGRGTARPMNEGEGEEKGGDGESPTKKVTASPKQ